MASGFPTFKLYASNGTTLIYDFENVVNITDFQDPATFVEHTSLRGQGSIIIEGSDSPWDLDLSFILQEDDYEALVASINSLVTTVSKFTKYILKVELTSGGSTKDYKVMRLNSFQFPIGGDRKKRITFQTGTVSFRVNTWA